MREIFADADLDRLRAVADIVWGRDEPLPDDVLKEHLPAATILVGTGWRLPAAAIERAPDLCAIMDVAGSFPPNIDYDACFRRGVRVLSCAPAFADQVAEMALAMTLAGGRGLVACHEQMRVGDEVTSSLDPC